MKSYEDGRTQVWLVEAKPNVPEEVSSLFMWAFFNREEAGFVYIMGKNARPDMHWTNTPLAFGSVANALHHIDLLKADLTTEEN